MSKAAANILVSLSPAESADFRAVAKAQGIAPAALAARIVLEWLGPSRVERIDQRAIAARRLALLIDWRDNRRRPIDVAKRTLNNWALRYQGHGLAGLIDRRRGPKPRPDGFAEFKSEVVRLYRSKRLPTVTGCYREAVATAQQRGWPIPSYKVAQRTIAARQQHSAGA